MNDAEILELALQYQLSTDERETGFKKIDTCEWGTDGGVWEYGYIDYIKIMFYCENNGLELELIPIEGTYDGLITTYRKKGDATKTNLKA
jgi:hypothetical protein